MDERLIQQELNELFRSAIDDAIQRHVQSRGCDDVANYLSELLIAFSHTDRIFGIRDKFGKQLVLMKEMMAEGDLMMNAESFDREREVHRHIGDVLLFSTGLFPKFLDDVRVSELGTKPEELGRESYLFVSSFSHGKYEQEAPVFAKLGHGFSDFSFCLKVVGDHLGLRYA